MSLINLWENWDDSEDESSPIPPKTGTYYDKSNAISPLIDLWENWDDSEDESSPVNPPEIPQSVGTDYGIPITTKDLSDPLIKLLNDIHSQWTDIFQFIRTLANENIPLKKTGIIFDTTCGALAYNDLGHEILQCYRTAEILKSVLLLDPLLNTELSVVGKFIPNVITRYSFGGHMFPDHVFYTIETAAGLYILQSYYYSYGFSSESGFFKVKNPDHFHSMIELYIYYQDTYYTIDEQDWVIGVYEMNRIFQNYTHVVQQDSTHIKVFTDDTDLPNIDITPFYIKNPEKFINRVNSHMCQLAKEANRQLLFQGRLGESSILSTSMNVYDNAHRPPFRSTNLTGWNAKRAGLGERQVGLYGPIGDTPIKYKVNEEAQFATLLCKTIHKLFHCRFTCKTVK